MQHLKRCGFAQFTSTRLIRILIAIALITLILLGSFPPTVTAAETPSVEWRQTYNNLEVLSIIQTSDGGYALVGASEAADAATFAHPEIMKGSSRAQRLIHFFNGKKCRAPPLGKPSQGRYL